ncbi:hypothetical protein AC579_8830 [Pseudocercospora musae]|uniref:F-box domain-containing protein n=1 Tax=Pseudocercospora musae TaxID=113226 RepID=A0A139HDN1_9PEZI|nr:hypothetical protein AC579_8830 [Pseudocercospora musae]
MAPANYGTTYARFSRRQCFAFIRRHGGTIPPGKNIDPRQILRQMDADARFRFMDLPPEMRNDVYTILLSRNPKEGRKAFPEILRVSKQLYKEALGILRAESFFRIGVAVTKTNMNEFCDLSENLDATIRTNREHQVHLGCSLTHFESLRTVEKIQLHIVLCTLACTDGDWRTLTALVSLIKIYATNLRTLELTAEDERRPGGYNIMTNMSSALEAFSKLPENVTLDNQGLDDATYDAVWAALRRKRAFSRHA